MDYFTNDFRDNKNKFYVTNQTDIKSDKLNIKVFSHKWKKKPEYNDKNSFYGYTDFRLYYTFDYFNFGLLQIKNINGTINDGFIQTWHSIGNNFSTLLLENSIGKNIEYNSISGNVNYSYSQGIFLQKIFISSNHYISTKLNIFYGRELQNLEVYGRNKKDKFILSFDYYYSSNNKITKYYENDSFSGLGVGLDLSYIYEKNNYFIYAGIYNIGAFINWKSVSYMHYDFDSEVIYKGDDGYNHYKPFGSGYYKYDIDYKQKIKEYYKTSFDYKFTNYFNMGLNSSLYDESLYNEIYIVNKYNKIVFKYGYLFENKNAIFGIKYKRYQFEISNKFDSSDETSFYGNFKIEF